MKNYIYECPQCEYIDSDPEMAETHCIDVQSSLW
jgi:hypothetical protein